MMEGCPFCDSEEIDDSDLDDSSCTCYAEYIGSTLSRLKNTIKTIDVSEVNFPVGILFATNGKVAVNESLSTPTHVFETIEEAMD